MLHLDALRELTTFFDALAPRWHAMQTDERRARLDRLLAPHHSWFREARTILDIGTGTGAFLPHLCRAAPQAQVIALDLSTVMLAFARAEQNDNRVRAWIQGDAHRLSLPAQTVDGITCHNCFAHLEDRPAALREMLRVLVPGGVLFILHDIPREQVNAIHSSAENPRIRRHLLPPVDEAAVQVEAAGFCVLRTADTDHYLILAQRPLA